jgi:hypothetical protein
MKCHWYTYDHIYMTGHFQLATCTSKKGAGLS